ncbi:LytTR family DNA-binding domain-containing protein [Membranihabitans maritimus]|uniref:LytTR family DNA-binding domain-containing protein n=1 Tax=Membranihabitans maritimus TaxID=2904244 RepID=UPI001F263539|nr:LytTR family DNA-binding domain-containing protein [Membranihabitans maritimus]
MKSKKHYTIKGESGILRFSGSELMYIEVDGYLSTFYFEDGSTFSKTVSLKKLEEQLDESFFRINRNCIVNLSQRLKFMKKERRLSIREKTTLTVSNRQIKKLEKTLMSLDNTFIG